ncbi:MAG TPA: universal stress protein, partial [Thermoleophilaceae bacterium]|nr:universal stress protein [Thermoleophilaceae bacterium]
RPHDARVIVVGYDGSPTARRALSLAADRTGPGGQLVVVHAFSAPPEWEGRPYYQRNLDAHQAHGREVLAEVEREDLGVPVETDLVEGSPARALIQVAEARDADEIVVGSRGFGRFRAALGSTSHQLLHETRWPVLVVPAEDASR